LLSDSYPAGRFDRTERIKIAAPLEMPALALADILHQDFSLGRNRGGIWPKILREKCGAVLIEYLAEGLVGELNRGQTSPDSFHQHGDSEIADDCAIRGPHRADDVGRHALIRQALMDRRDEGSI